MTLQLGNLFTAIPTPGSAEEFLPLMSRQGVRVERIVSRGHATPAGQWYDQEADEWVVLLTGAAGLLIEDGAEVLEMKPGDWVLLPAHLRHRVEWTDPDHDTIWLAVHAG
jgi:cupin 2 domain-containing protein